MSRSLELSTPPPTVCTGSGAGDWINNWSCLCDEATIKSLKCGVQRPSRLMNTSTCQEGCAPQLHRDRSSCTQSPSWSYPMYCFIRPFICILYYIPSKKLVPWYSLSSVNHSSKWSNPKRGSLEPPTDSWSPPPTSHLSSYKKTL